MRHIPLGRLSDGPIGPCGHTPQATPGCDEDIVTSWHSNAGPHDNRAMRWRLLRHATQPEYEVKCSPRVQAGNRAIRGACYNYPPLKGDVHVPTPPSQSVLSGQVALKLSLTLVKNPCPLHRKDQNDYGQGKRVVNSAHTLTPLGPYRKQHYQA